MVRNTKGGKGSKSIARKSVAASMSSSSLRLPENDLETLAVVTKFYGNMCDILTHDNKTYKCHIRGKFKGKFKRNSFVSVGKIVLVGFRHYEEPHFLNTDLLYVYDLSEYSQFSFLTKYDLSGLIAIHNNLGGGSGGSALGDRESDVIFDVRAEPSFPPTDLAPVAEEKVINIIEEEQPMEINIDDI